MMSVPVTTTTRRVLQTLDANTRNTSSPKKSPKLPHDSVDSAREQISSKSNLQIIDALLAGTKRNASVISVEEIAQPKETCAHASEEQEPKRIKITTSDARGALSDSAQVQDVPFGRRIVFPKSNAMLPRSPARSNGTPSPTHSSPASTCFSSVVGMDDSQDTVLTVPEDVRNIHHASFAVTSSQPGHGSLSRAEIRQKAKTLRLRLSLASYKLRTNQVNVPISRLQIRATSPELPRLPRPDKAAKKDLGIVRTPKKKRTPLPSSSSPFIELKMRDALPAKIMQEIGMEQPIVLTETAAKVDGEEGKSEEKPRGREVMTPILPRYRDGLTDPPILASPTCIEREKETDLTSSVVKGRAANGLLSLRGIVA